MFKLADYIMNFLVSKGVSKVFMLPGGGAMHLDDSLGRCGNLEYTCFYARTGFGHCRRGVWPTY